MLWQLSAVLLNYQTGIKQCSLKSRTDEAWVLRGNSKNGWLQGFVSFLQLSIFTITAYLKKPLQLNKLLEQTIITDGFHRIHNCSVVNISTFFPDDWIYSDIQICLLTWWTAYRRDKLSPNMLKEYRDINKTNKQKELYSYLSTKTEIESLTSPVGTMIWNSCFCHSGNKVSHSWGEPRDERTASTPPRWDWLHRMVSLPPLTKERKKNLQDTSLKGKMKS